MRLFYATTAPADFISAHRAWKSGEHFAREVSLTFSGQIEDFVAEVGGDALFVSGFADGAELLDGPIKIRHVAPRHASGWRWHVEHRRHAKRLAQMAKDFGADVAVVDSGTMPYSSLAALQRVGIKVIPVFHNTLYGPKGPTLLQRIEAPATQRFLNATTPIHVSPACKRQVGHGLEIRAQFDRDYFKRVTPASFAAPFNVFFIGRVDAIKGVFDIVEAARLCGEEVTWTVCGGGPDLERLREASKGLPIDVRGWTSLEDLVELRSRSQAAIVPTTTDFEEGMAMTAVEAILSGRPLITNWVVPALEVLRPACVEARPNDPKSYADAALSLARNPGRWQELVDACPPLAGPFYDERHSLTAALAEILRPDLSNYADPPGKPTTD